MFTTTVTGRHLDEGTKLSRYWKKKDYGTRRKGMSADLSSKMEMMNSKDSNVWLLKALGWMNFLVGKNQLVCFKPCK